MTPSLQISSKANGVVLNNPVSYLIPRAALLL
jgi:hypothetical protein